ncbi:MAG: glutamine--fructose-6-phosphate transaminase (isomerizing) [Roseovarius sp.]|nr:glutamine--fructose-6-phosphate transaminase (isomerizing) [Roseovarius sp.]
MCGIVGVLGRHEAAPILVEALKRVEYRGYDSAGIATINNNRIERRRAVGKLVNLSDRLVHEPLAGKSGIGHTRWATHGIPNLENAHPHQAGPVAVVHNGIIENFRDLRNELSQMGIAHRTDTDTETVALMARRYMDEGANPVEAGKLTIKRLEGAYALCFLFDGEPDLLVAARKGSPLAIGIGDDEMFVGSDAIALASLTRRIMYLEEGDVAVISRKSVEVTSAHGKIANREVKTIDPGLATVNRGGYKHYMAKEIAEQPSVIGNLLNHYINEDKSGVSMDIDFREFDRLTMVACGTAHYACLTAKHWFEKIAGLPVDVDIASEFRYREPLVTARSAAIFVSQSGETADTLAALRYCTGKVKRILSVVNVPESSISRESDFQLAIHAGREVAVASTKAFTCQLTVLFLMALKAAGDRGAIKSEELSDRLSELKSLPSLLNHALDGDHLFMETSQHLSKASNALFMGRGLMYPLALEGALKLKEISYIHAEAYACGELKHGPIALIDDRMPVVVMAPRDSVFDKTVSNMQEVKARGGKIILISDPCGVQEAGDDALLSLSLPKTNPLLTPILYALPAQLLAYHTAVAKGTDVDQPRNLAKSVTVE